MECSVIRWIVAWSAWPPATLTSLWLALATGAPPLVRGDELSPDPLPTRHMEYEIQRNGKPIGYYHFAISNSVDGFRQVNVSMETRVTLLSAPIYHARHERIEHWRGDTLLALRGRSVYDRKHYNTELTNAAGTARLTVNGESLSVTPPVVTFVPWLLGHSGEVMLITEKGRLLRVTREDVGLDTVELPDGHRELRHFVYHGPWSRDAWFDAQGRLRQATYEKRGAQIRVLLKNDFVKTNHATPVADSPQAQGLVP